MLFLQKPVQKKEITVRVKDSEENYMEGVTVEAEFGNTLMAALYSGSEVTDAEGKTVFTANALLPGYTDITFRAAGTSFEKTLTFRAALEERRPKRPTAAIGETQFGENSPKENYITVKGGEQLVISAEDGVTIYYTTDDTCPCQNSSSRKIYTNPIPITENTKFRIAAYKDGMDYSERLNITVTVDDTHQHSYGSEWKSDENGHGTNATAELSVIGLNMTGRWKMQRMPQPLSQDIRAIRRARFAVMR